MVEAHLTTCHDCVAWLTEQLPPTDRLVDMVRSSLCGASYVDEPFCQEGTRYALEVANQLPFVDDSTPRPEPQHANVHAILRDYQLESVIGQGGMGTVYRARHLKLDRVVAVKLLQGRGQKDSVWLTRFEQEMRAAGRLDHPNIVRATDAGEASGVPYLAMEFIDGLDLAQWVAKHGPIAYPIACQIVSQAAAGLQHAHEHGLIHRDMKPANVMLTTGGQIKLLDLGVALFSRTDSIGKGGVRDSLAHRPMRVGTVDFMAPEQFDDQTTLDARADIYSLGGTLFYLLTGQTPWQVPYGTPQSAPPVPWPQSVSRRLRASQPDLPPSLQSLILQMLSPEPNDRPATAGEVLASLAAFAANTDLSVLMRDHTTGMPAKDTTTGQSGQPIDSAVRIRHDSAADRRRPRLHLHVTIPFLIASSMLAGVAYQLGKSHAPTLVTTIASPSTTTAALPLNRASRTTAAEPSQTPLAPSNHGESSERVSRKSASLSLTPGPAIRSFDLVPEENEENEFAAGYDSGAIVLSSLSGESVKTLLGHDRAVSALAMSRHGTRLASGGEDHTVRLWDVSTASLERQFTGHTGPLLTVAWSPDDSMIASAGWDARILLWDANDGSHREMSSYANSNETPTLRALEDLTQLEAHVTWIRTLAFSPDGKHLASGGNEALLATWDLAAGTIVQRFIGHTAPISKIVYTADARRLVSASYDNTVIVWDVASGQPQFVLSGHKGPVRDIALSPSGQRLASASADTTVRLWDLTDGVELACLRGHTQCVNALGFRLTDRQLLSASDDGTVRTWMLDDLNNVSATVSDPRSPASVHDTTQEK
jgi:serine/threonine protein kinase